MRRLSQALAVVAMLLAAYAVVGRFVYAPSVLGWMVRDGMAGSSVMMGTNTLLLLAILAELYGRKQQ
jgi:hypothetical protein